MPVLKTWVICDQLNLLLKELLLLFWANIVHEKWEVSKTSNEKVAVFGKWVGTKWTKSESEAIK